MDLILTTSIKIKLSKKKMTLTNPKQNKKKKY